MTKSSTKKAGEMIGIGICTGIGFMLAAVMIVVAYGALMLGADLTSTLTVLIILIILMYVVFAIANAYSKKYGNATTFAIFMGVGFTIGLIIITLVLAYFNIASSITIGSG